MASGGMWGWRWGQESHCFAWDQMKLPPSKTTTCRGGKGLGPPLSEKINGCQHTVSRARRRRKGSFCPGIIPPCHSLRGAAFQRHQTRPTFQKYHFQEELWFSASSLGGKIFPYPHRSVAASLPASPNATHDVLPQISPSAAKKQPSVAPFQLP